MSNIRQAFTNLIEDIDPHHLEYGDPKVVFIGHLTLLQQEVASNGMKYAHHSVKQALTSLAAMVMFESKYEKRKYMNTLVVAYDYSEQVLRVTEDAAQAFQRVSGSLDPDHPLPCGVGDPIFCATFEFFQLLQYLYETKDLTEHRLDLFPAVTD